jgi:hypothetical protein
MLLARVLFDVCGSITYSTVWSFVFFLIYAMLQLFMVRARVRDFCGNVNNWTQFYGMGLILGAILVLITIIPAFSSIASKAHYNVIDYAFDFLMICPFVYLCVVQRPNEGEIAKQSFFSQNLQLEVIPVRITKFSNRGHSEKS